MKRVKLATLPAMAIVMVNIAFSLDTQRQTSESAKENLYLQRIVEWRGGKHAILMEDPFSSDIGEERLRRVDELDRRLLVPLRAQVLPYLLIVDQVDDLIGWSMYKISKFLPHKVVLSREPRKLLSTTEEFPEVAEKNLVDDARKIWLFWWLEGERRTPMWFAARYRKWLALVQQDKTKEAQEMYQRLLNIGIAAIPLWLEKLNIEQEPSTKQKILEALTYLTDGEVKPTMSVQECLSWWEASKEKWTIPFPKGKREFLQWLEQEALWEEDDEIFAVAPVKTISRVEDEEAIEMLVRLLKHPKPAVRAQSLEQLQKLFGEQLPEGYALGVGTDQWERPSDLVEMKKYDAASRQIKKMREKMKSETEANQAAEALAAWWQNSKGKVTIYGQRAWVELP